MQNKNNNYRVLTYSDGSFVPQYKFIVFWIGFGTAYATIQEAKDFIANEIKAKTKPTVVNISYLD